MEGVGSHHLSLLLYNIDTGAGTKSHLVPDDLEDLQGSLPELG
nr:hypothetical protein [Thermus thermophilus]